MQTRSAHYSDSDSGSDSDSDGDSDSGSDNNMNMDNGRFGEVSAVQQPSEHARDIARRRLLQRHAADS